MTKYKQCKLVRTMSSTATMEQVSWIPQQYAIEGKTLRLEGAGGSWTDGWVVKLVGQTTKEEKQLPDPHRAIRGHRISTGDALPKKS
jgi:hypothetical protein